MSETYEFMQKNALPIVFAVLVLVGLGIGLYFLFSGGNGDGAGCKSQADCGKNMLCYKSKCTSCNKLKVVPGDLHNSNGGQSAEMWVDGTVGESETTTLVYSPPDEYCDQGTLTDQTSNTSLCIKVANDDQFTLYELQSGLSLTYKRSKGNLFISELIDGKQFYMYPVGCSYEPDDPTPGPTGNILPGDKYNNGAVLDWWVSKGSNDGRETNLYVRKSDNCSYLSLSTASGIEFCFELIDENSFKVMYSNTDVIYTRTNGNVFSDGKGAIIMEHPYD